MSTCPKCKSTDVQEGCGSKRLCNDCMFYWLVGDEENGYYLNGEPTKNDKSAKKGGGGCCGKGAKSECDKQKDKQEENKQEEENEKKKGGGCCGKGAKAECQQQAEPPPPPPPSIKDICAQLPALVNPLVPSGIEIANFVQAVMDDYNAISSVSYPPNCSQLGMVAGLVTKYSGLIPAFA